VTVEVFVQQTVNAISLGGTYALLALGLGVIFSILGMINMAHGELMTITGYALVAAVGAGLPFAVAVPLSVLGGVLAALAMERIAFRPFRRAGGETLLITSFAVSKGIQVLLQDLISPRSKSIAFPDFLSHEVAIAGIGIGTIQLLSIVVSIGMLLFLTWFLKRTLIGIAMRAAATDFSVTRLMGIPANTIIATAFAISGLLASVAGLLWMSQRASVDPAMGFVPIIKAFIAAILGGLGSLTGAVAGGFLLGAIETYLAAYLPPGAQSFHDALTLAIVILILLFRPEGLMVRQDGGRSAVPAAVVDLRRRITGLVSAALRTRGRKV
jgi:branched-chain amino acid transport system permease protein